MTAANIVPPSERINWRALAGVCIAKNESDIIGVNLRHLYGYGLRQFVFADNGSTDNTVALVEEFRRDHPDATVIILSDHTPYLRPERRDALCAFAARFFSVEWVFPFDADDFLWLSPGPPIELEKIDRRVAFLELPWLHLHPARHPDLERTLVAPRIDGATVGTTGRKSKTIVRWNDDLAIPEGAHYVVSKRGRFLRRMNAAQLGLASVHYPIRTADQLVGKFVGGAAALSHWRSAANILEATNSQGRTPLYDAFISLDAKQLLAFCAQLEIEPRKLHYIVDMVTADPVSFPADGKLKSGLDVPSFFDRRAKNKDNALANLGYKIEARVIRWMNDYSRWRAGV